MGIFHHPHKYSGQSLAHMGNKSIMSAKQYQYELYKETVRHLVVEVKGFDVEAIENSVSSGKAARVIKGGRLGFAYSTDAISSDNDVIKMAESASLMVAPDSDVSFPPSEKTTAIKNDLSAFLDTTIEDKISIAKRLEGTPLIHRTIYEELIREVHIENSNGIDTGFKTGNCAIIVTAVAEDKSGSERATEVALALAPQALDVEKIGMEAASRATACLNSRKISSCRCRAILDKHVVSEVLKLIAPAFFADFVFKKKSSLAGKMGEVIYSPNITIINDATLKDAFSSVPYDAEGAASKKTVLVQNGRIASFLADAVYAKKAGVALTASSIRPMIIQMPRIGVHNLYIMPGSKDIGALKKDMGHGFYITELLGLHTANPITGDFSVGASGFWIDGGMDAYGVKGVTIAGNLHGLLGCISFVGSDLKFWSTTGGVSLLIEEMAVSG